MGKPFWGIPSGCMDGKPCSSCTEPEPCLKNHRPPLSPAVGALAWEGTAPLPQSLCSHSGCNSGCVTWFHRRSFWQHPGDKASTSLKLPLLSSPTRFYTSATCSASLTGARGCVPAWKLPWHHPLTATLGLAMDSYCIGITLEYS